MENSLKERPTLKNVHSQVLQNVVDCLDKSFQSFFRRSKSGEKPGFPHQYICIEDLDIKHMVEGSHLAKSLTDASWNQFRQSFTYKAAEAGRKLGLVNLGLHKPKMHSMWIYSG